MSRPTQGRNDFEAWRELRENETKPFPYVYPQMAPRFRYCCIWLRALFLLEWCGISLMILAGTVGCVLLVVEPQAGQLFDLVGTAFVAGLVLFLICRLLRHSPRFFWHCPCCGTAFPYYAPSHYSDVLKESDCLHKMEHLRIPYIRLKFCPLVVPSVCPECRAKFFEMTDDPHKEKLDIS